VVLAGHDRGLIWNLLGCAAYLSDVRPTPQDVARMSADEQALYAARSTWAISATAVAVWGGALGCLGLILGERLAFPLLVASLVGIIVQDAGLFIATRAVHVGAAIFVLQGPVLLGAIGLVLLARYAAAQRWLA